MHYIIYKITNTINHKIYIGLHQTDDLDDGYMGSGTYLKRAIEKYGIENFKKEILFDFDNPIDMRAKEAEIVNEEFLLRNDVYNLMLGGTGGWSHVNGTYHRVKGHTPDMYQRNGDALRKKYATGELSSERFTTMVKKRHADGLVNYATFTGRKHSDETKRLIGLANSRRIGDKTSQYGTFWITNGKDNEKSLGDIPDGWWKGRTYTPNLTTSIDKCQECVIDETDRYWWNVFIESDLSVSEFVKAVYPHSRATFYNMKKRLNIR